MKDVSVCPACGQPLGPYEVERVDLTTLFAVHCSGEGCGEFQISDKAWTIIRIQGYKMSDEVLSVIRKGQKPLVQPADLVKPRPVQK